MLFSQHRSQFLLIFHLGFTAFPCRDLAATVFGRSPNAPGAKRLATEAQSRWWCMIKPSTSQNSLRNFLFAPLRLCCSQGPRVWELNFALLWTFLGVSCLIRLWDLHQYINKMKILLYSKCRISGYGQHSVLVDWLMDYSRQSRGSFLLPIFYLYSVPLLAPSGEVRKEVKTGKWRKCELGQWNVLAPPKVSWRPR